MTPSPSISPKHQRLLENASWLQRLAENLVRDPHHADDMAQQTMEAALEGNPPDMQQHRPWLARILRNKVYASHRVSTRRLAREQKVARTEKQDGILHDAVERAEIGKRLTESIMKLEEPFRSTLLMRFHEDQSPKEIARKLGIPASTVRTRIHRGLEKLREEISTSWGKDWNACYPAVLAFSRTSAASGLKVGSLFLPLALLAGIASTLLVIQPWESKESDREEILVQDSLHSAESSTVSLEDTGESGGNAMSFGGSLQRETIPTSTALAGTATGNPIILKGRVIAKDTGEPLAGCRVKLFGILSQSREAVFHDGPKWKNPDPILTSEDGTFAFAIEDPHPNLRVLIDFSFPGRISWRSEWGLHSNDLVSTDLGDIPMERGTVLKGKVVHEDGTLMLKARISMDGIIGQVSNYPIGSYPVSGHVNGQGEFQLNTALPPGARDCKVRVKEHLLVGPKFISVEEGSQEQFVTFVVKSMPYVDGYVTLADGSPAKGVHVNANKGSGWLATGDTDANGYFRIYSTTESEKPFTFTLSGTGFQSTTTADFYEWGQRGVSLTASESLSVQIVVREDSNLQPLERFTVKGTYQAPNGGGSTWHRNQFPGPHAQGMVKLEGLNAGTYKIEVVTADPKWRLKKEVEFVLPLTVEQPIELLMEEGRLLRVKVLDSENNPISGSTVVIGDSFSLLVQQGERGIVPSRPESIHLIEGLSLPGRAETDENGTAEFFLPTEFESGGIYIAGAHLKKTIALEAAALNSREVVVVVQPLSSIHGKLVFPESMAGEVGLFFENQNGMFFGIGVNQENLVLPNESRDYHHLLEPGEYKAFFMAPNPSNQGFGFGAGWALFTPAIGEFSLGEGSALELDWDVSQFASGALSGRILVDGAPQRNAAFSLLSTGVTRFNERTDDQGRFYFEDLPSNDYQVQFQAVEGERPWGWHLMSEQEAKVQSNTEVAMDFDFPYRTLSIQPLHPKTQEPFPNTKWSLRNWQGGEIEADAEGWLEISPASHLPMHLSLQEKEVTYLVRNIQMDADKMEQSISVTASYPEQR